MDLVHLLVVVLVLGLIFWLVIWTIDQIPGLAPFKMVARAIVAIIAVLILLGMIFGGINIPLLRVR
jgi:hypothetical protein